MKDVDRHETQRLNAIRELDVLDTDPDPLLDGITRAAASLCEVPVSLVSIVDLDRQWFKSQCGIDAKQTARDIAFCSYAIASNDPFEVRDTRDDARFKNNPLVTNPPYLRYYFGVPLVGKAGYRYGTLCVIDTKPRELTSFQKDAIKALAEVVLKILESNRKHDVEKNKPAIDTQTLAALPSAVVTSFGDDEPVELNQLAQKWFGTRQGLVFEEWLSTHDFLDPECNQPSRADHPLKAAQSGRLCRNQAFSLDVPGKPPRVVTCSTITLGGANGLQRAVLVMHDITELHGRVETLSKERRRLETTIEGTRAGTWEWHIPTGEAHFNARWAEIVGYTLEELKPMSFETWRSLVHRDDVGPLEDALNANLSGDSDFDLIYRLAHKDGHWVWVHDRGRVHEWDKSGSPLWMSGTRLDITDLKKIQEKARVETEKFSGAFESAALGFSLVSLQGAWIDVNPALCEMLGYTRSELLKTDFQTLTHPEDLNSDLELLGEVLAGLRTSYHMDKRYFRKDGMLLWARLSVSLVHDSEGSPLHFVSLIQDVTAQRVAEAQLIAAEQHTRTILESVGDAIVLVDSNLKVEYANTVALTLLGYEIEEFLGKNIGDVLVIRSGDGHGETIDMSNLTLDFANALSQKSDLVAESRGKQIPVSIVGTPLGEGSRPPMLLVIHDSSAERLRSLNLDRLSQIDALTGLANRRGFERALDAIRTSPAKQSSIAIIDLDEFKGVNDSHGHAAGDALLREVATRLLSAVRKDDVAARIGGDEFALVLPGCPKHRAIEISENIRSLVQDISIPWEKSELSISMSVGVAIFDLGTDVQVLVNAADDACYQAKRSGKNRVCVVEI